MPGRPKKRLGQHFLSDPAILGRIVDGLSAPPGAPVVEIGPGLGTLTAVLIERGARVTAIERDRDLVPALVARFPAAGIVHADALEADWRGLADIGREPWFVIGNIPYNITSPLIDRALLPPRPERIVFLVQREVADRLAARPGSAAYGAMTVGVRVVAGVEWLFGVAAGAFRPRPAVESAVIRLVPLASPMVQDADLPSFRRLVTGLFGARRKQLSRGLRIVTGLGAEPVQGHLEALGIAPARRPEVLAPEEFVALHRRLVDAGWRPE